MSDTLVPEAKHASAPLRSEVAQTVDFSAIRYSQSWEDPGCLERALDIQPDDRVLSIAAAGDNSFALLLMGDAWPRARGQRRHEPLADGAGAAQARGYPDARAP